MQVIEIGDTRVVQIAPDGSIDQAIALMEAHGFRHLPVVDRGTILGMVSDRDLLSAVGMRPSRDRIAMCEGPARVGATRISQIMSKPAVTAEADVPLEQAAQLMLARRIRALPLVYKDRIAGIVTETDFLKCYLDDRPMGRRPGWRLAKVADHMTSPVITLRPSDTFIHALRVMQTHRLRHLPIVDSDKLLGIVSDRDMRRVLGNMRIDAEEEDPHTHVKGGIGQPSDVVMRDIMTQEVLTIEPDTTVAEVADHLVKNKIGSLPVVDNSRLIGIITEADLLRLFVEAFKG